MATQAWTMAPARERKPNRDCKGADNAPSRDRKGADQSASRFRILGEFAGLIGLPTSEFVLCLSSNTGIIISMSDNFAQNVKQVADWLHRADRVAVMTGAGVSAESGVATFREAGGLWEGRRAEEVATPEAFRADPESVWRFYKLRRTGLLECRPNPAHEALAELERICANFCLITQNVDDLHRQAGSQNLIELHGNIWIDRCWDCDRQERPEQVSEEPIPRCSACGGMMRPGVVWFGEMLPPEAIDGAQSAAAQADVMLVVGTSSLVQPAASLAMVAQQNGAKVVEINPEATPLTHSADLVIAEKAGIAVPAVLEALPSES